MNLCEGRPVWHASIAKLNQTFRPVTCRSVANKKLAYHIGEQLLEGVGVGETYMKQGQYAFHIRRSLAPNEIAFLSHEWLAIPAVDMAG